MTNTTRGATVHFRELPGGGFFPPIIPNGTFIASPMVGHPRQAVFEVRDDGVYAGGIHLLWEDITGILLDEVRCKLTSDKYRSGGLEFQLGQCELRTEGERITRLAGYSVEYCLLNRVTYEKQRIDREFEREIDRL